ncbi:unnamed protein product [Meganyctiphanes norvegica]|uniref:BHLH domain-containing protein n=1 Tax=Meganyctiphanes norvegica TaxID=48144 RepID=A0AAV2R036_MEGNR
MSATVTQRLVPIRPSPHKSGLTSSNNKNITVITNASSPATLTPPKTGIKRKLVCEPSEDSVKCKRRINFGIGYVVSPAPMAVARRNQRERNRVKQVNNGFATLRNHIPGASKAKKISKVDTLKQAVEYINALQNLLDEHDRLMAQVNQVSQTSVSPALTTTIQPPTTLKIGPPMSSQYSTATTLLAHAPMQSQTHYRIVQYPSYYYSENISPIPASVYPLTASAVSPACSENSAASPTPSYDSAFSSSEGSVPTMTSVTNIFSPTTSIPEPHHHHVGYDIDPFSPEDDELLEAISLWQQGDNGI